MRKLSLMCSLYLMSIYIFLSVMASTELNMNDEKFNFYLSLFKILVIFLLLLSNFIYKGWKLTKFEFFLLFVGVILAGTLDSYIITVSFMILSGLSFSNFFNFLLYKEKYNLHINLSFLLSILFVFTLYYLGYLESRVLIDPSEYAIGDKVSLGFSHPNKAALLLVQGILLAYALRSRVFICLFISLYIYTFYDFGGRTAFGGLILLFLLILFGSIVRRRYILTMRLVILSLHILFPIGIVFFISKGNWYLGTLDLNHITSTRLFLMAELFNNNGLHFIPIKITGKIVDVGIANLLIGGGLVLYTMYVYLVNLYMKYEKDRRFITVLVCCLAMNFMENLINANMILSVVILARIIYIIRTNKV
ncbi:hypothetical protein [Actinobacillus equuli]|uniref:hypothetical protein n=1 Tax=Actinobacillus equuli TaxID=718 RepID=UPI0024181A66|nr:hypothetical protein [Actinobacillus equuli]MDG4953477.1 hypothetical protein [Actinobacillus equuli subsp. equuli]